MQQRVVGHGEPYQAKVYHRADRDDWETPLEIFAPLQAEFGFTLDVCATAENAKCVKYYTRADNALLQPWTGVCWMNPPYGHDVGEWVRKACESSLDGATVVCLVKATPDTQWWHTYVRFAELRFIKGRIRFVGAVRDAPFPSALLIFRPRARLRLRRSDHQAVHEGGPRHQNQRLNQLYAKIATLEKRLARYES